MNYLFIRITGSKFGSPEQAEVEWKIYSSAKKPLTASAKPLTLPNAAAEIKKTGHRNLKIIVFVLGDLVSLFDINLNRQQANYIHETLPFIMEEKVVDEVENLHFALGNKLVESEDSINFPVAAIKRNYMDKWTKALSALNIGADEFIPESLAIPEWTIMLDNNLALFRANRSNGSGIEVASVSSMAESTLKSGLALVDKITVYGAAEQLSTISKTSHMELKNLEHNVFETLCLFYLQDPQSGHFINLLQGNYEKNIADFSAPFQWRKIIRASIAGVSMLVLLNLGVAAYLELQAYNARNEVRSIYQSVSPQNKTASVTEMEKKLKLLENLNGATGFLPMIQEISGDIQHLPPNTIILNQIEYDSQKGMTIDLTSSEASAIESLRLSLEKVEYNVKIKSSIPEDSSVRAIMVIGK